MWIGVRLLSDLKLIKKKLLKEDKVEAIFEAMDCEHVTYSGGRIEAQLPRRFHSENRRSVQCKLSENLYCQIRNKADFKGGDIYSLVSYIKNDKRGEEDIDKDLPNAKRFICETLGWYEFLEKGTYKPKKDYVASLKAIANKRKRKREIVPNPPIPEEVLNDYLPYPSLDWMEEGISYETQKMYDIRFDLDSKRIIIPMRNRFGQLIGVKGRIMKNQDDTKKYLYLHKFNNGQEIFNFNYAHHYIIMHKKVYIFEGEKSCMKMFSNGIYNCVAIGSSDVTDVQASIIKQCGRDVEIIICFDKDKKAKDIKIVSDMFQGRVVLGMIDTLGLLGEKESPIDKGLDVFLNLEKNCLYPLE